MKSRNTFKKKVLNKDRLVMKDRKRANFDWMMQNVYKKLKTKKDKRNSWKNVNKHY